MDIGVPKERRPYEFRVGLTPSSVRALTGLKHRVYIEKDAGAAAGFSNDSYERAGGIIAYDSDEIYGRPDLLVKFSRPTYSEIQLMKEGIIVVGFLHFHASKRDKIELIVRRKISALSCELLEEHGEFTVLGAVSSLAGQMTPAIAAQCLNNLHGGSGILMGGAPGIPPAEVVVVGCGNAGSESARFFANAGAQVTVLDRDLSRLKSIYRSLYCSGKIITMLSTQSNLEKTARFADVLVLAAQIPGKRSPIVITEEMVKTMKQKSVIIDLAVDQGGNCETSHPTTHSSPTFEKHGVIHYCVPNMTSIVARTSSYAYNNALLPYLIKLVSEDSRKALESDPILSRAVVTLEGTIIHPSLKERLRE
ncbi:MAG TPA: alanine dehydrogenase, partial [Candidatus Hodarchaeales archaeon]|nr:alanine dehydrogenase [Candidatus Hodarchaeales archaeon]